MASSRFNPDELRGARKTAGKGQAGLAAELGTFQESLSRWDRGGCVPDPTRLVQLAAALGVTVEDFFQYDE